MTNEVAQELDYGINLAIGSLIQALGMHNENQARLANGNAPAYTKSDFDEISDQLSHNAVLSRWEGIVY